MWQNVFYPPNLKQHQLTSSGGKSHKCEDCRKVFCTHLELSKHQKIILVKKATNVEKLLLDFLTLPAQGSSFYSETLFMGKCWKIFSLQSLEKNHRVHSQERPCKCEGCVKAFGYRSDLIQLKWIHRREKPKPCEGCGRCFTNNSTLSNLHKSYTGEKHYKWECIDKPFKGSLSVNTKVLALKSAHNSRAYYEGFICQSTLADHQRIHTWENL